MVAHSQDLKWCIIPIPQNMICELLGFTQPHQDFAGPQSSPELDIFLKLYSYVFVLYIIML